MAAPLQLSGTVERVTFHTEETGACVLKVMPDGQRQLITLLGKAPRVVIGERFQATGQWEEHRVHGRQFKAESLRLLAPESTEGMERYLGSGLIEGIGPAYAKRLVAKFGHKVIDVIENESVKLENVDGIGSKRRKEIRESWMKQKAVHGIMLHLAQHGISTARALRIYKTYGEAALEVLMQDPYRLAVDIRGVGFKTADDIAQRVGLPADSEQRLRAGLRHVLVEAAHAGHCYLPELDLLGQAEKLLGASVQRLQEELLVLQQTEDVIRVQPEQVYLPHLRRAELSIGQKLRELMQEAAVYPSLDLAHEIGLVEQATGKTLADSQRRCVQQAVQSRIMIITGGPGVGKTTILNTVLTVLRKHSVRVVLAAPTGRAAKRMSESTGLEAKTLHRLLEFQGEGQWGRSRSKPLVGDLFVVDECSMIDVSLMAQFLSALPHGAHLLLVGDADQLPSVGPGMVLGDLIASGAVPCVRLTEIFRQAAHSRIITSAHAINAGQLPELKPTRDADFFFIEEPEPERLRETLIGLIKERLPAKYGFDPKADIQVLSPMNRNTLGTRALNEALQAALNPAQETKFELDRFGSTFRVGDKVLQTHNNYEKEVFNGDLGFIIEIQTEPVRVVVRFEGNRLVAYEPGELDELALAYAMTIHKSQGSEFPCVVIPMSTQHYIMLERSLIYTGITRARKLVVLVGDKKALSIAVQKQETRMRHTGLRAVPQS